jgi:transcriptional regulator with XRE-family HTH domain
MGIETRERGGRELESGAQVISGQLGKTIQRLRKAYNLSLSELAEQSGVAKSIISQIERNETNPTLATIWRLSQALDVSIERVLSTNEEEPSSRRSPVRTRRSWSPRTASCVSPSSAGSRPSNGCNGMRSAPSRAASSIRKAINAARSNRCR